ncbi:protein FAM47A-like [Myotis myotis]|uniref:Family with sequence similarity 47 member A n=1 Tax=Myotis myotis TaxID=51298 RepID=A0A7J7YCX7_MYOMY|nr:protein FAM47A-like [Myotis myotis]KAF6359715.1 hypothetical protein mMyoMyo1_004907 [Myotis myotis]
MACQQWPLPEPHEGWMLKSDLRKKALIESGLIKPWQSGPKLNKKPEPSQKWMLGPGPLEPLPLGMKCKPWFKDRDRLPSRYLSRQNKQLAKCPTSMDSRRWVFVKEGLDDFRTGCPSAEDVITRGPREGFLPMIAHRIPRPPPKKIHRQPPTGAELCSKLSPAQRARKAFVENIEANLTQHSLANCPNLEEALPPDLLLKVLEVLDPDRKLEDTWAYCEGTKERKKTPTHLCEEHPEEVNLEPPQAVNLEPPQAVNLEPPEAVNLEPPQAVNVEPPEAVHPESAWKLNLEPPEEDNLEPEDQAHVETAKESLQSYLFSLFPEEEINAACTIHIPKDPGLQKSRRRIREFCRWIDDNFGDIGIDEEDLMKQFEVDLEVPLTHNTVKIKKISQLPLNIRPCKQLDDIQQRKFSLQEGNWERKLRKPEDPYKPKREKIRYGAWYLDPKSWKKLVNDQPLPDPKVVPDKEHLTDGRHLEPDIIDELYGPIAFKDFIVSKGYKMPGVIEKMFMRKGWNYESVKTPIHRVMKLLSKPKEEDSGDKED